MTAMMMLGSASFSLAMSLCRGYACVCVCGGGGGEGMTGVDRRGAWHLCLNRMPDGRQQHCVGGKEGFRQKPRRLWHSVAHHIACCATPNAGSRRLAVA